MKKVEDFMNSILRCTTITLAAQNPFQKTSLLFNVVSHFLSQGQKVQYIDLDLQFSLIISNLRSEVEPISIDGLEIFCPNEFDLIDSLVSLLSREEIGSGGAVIIDSVNSLQNLLAQAKRDQDIAKANHEAAIILTLFQDLVRRNSKSLILSNIVRSRPHLRNGVVSWDKELVGGRMIKLKSDLVLAISEVPREQESPLSDIRIEVVSVSKNCEINLRPGQKFELRNQLLL